ncbi:MAG: hydrogenase small subunit [Cyclobacteriaceae bacterium]|nr:hydrogenase small subunit [Cyclobacteriaceae bacterium]
MENHPFGILEDLNTKKLTVYEEMKERGYSRRDFMKFCSTMAAFIGLSSSVVGQVANALETKRRPPVLWMHFQECTCCSESFIRTSHPIVADILLDKISLDYTETLQAASGHQAEKSLHDTMEESYGEYILMVEGSIPLANPGYCMIGGISSLEILKEAAAGAKAIIAWGSCASNGCVQSARPNPTKATPIHKIIKNKPIIKVPGCPPIGEVMAGVVVHLLAFDEIPELDNQGRPKAFYSRRVHDTCYRRPNYDAGLFVESWDDTNAKKGYCLYKLGCKGPVTYNACAVTKWNGGTSFPIQSGHGCIGCSENNFWDNGPLYKHLAEFPGFGIESNADKIGVFAAGAAAAGIAAHTIATNIRKRKLIDSNIEEGRKGME